jgi:hypothetical protein
MAVEEARDMAVMADLALFPAMVHLYEVSKNGFLFRECVNFTP